MGKQQEEAMESYRKLFAYAAGFFQIVLVVLYGMMTEYGPGPDSSSLNNSEIDQYYPFYQDVHVMIFIGFGFLMTFLKKYGFSSVGYNFLISCLAIQWAMVCNGLLHDPIVKGKSGLPIKLGITNLITGDFAAGAVLISFGAVLGKTSPLQMLLVVFFELIFYAVNESIGAGILSAVDMGGSIFVHTFGAYFGLAMSWVITRSKIDKATKEETTHPKNGSDKTSDMFAMIGTVFLWMFWPSFNGALATEDQQYRVVINTVIALSASCVATFLFITFFSKENKLDMVSIQNATLAGGVAVGSSSDLVIEPWGALVVGLVAGAWSVIGYEKIQPFLSRCIGLDDTCGVHNLHGMPGIIGALGGAISAANAGTMAYGSSIGRVFPERAPSNATEAALLGIEPGSDRSAQDQAAIQLAALAITLGISIGGGLITGMIIKMPCFLPGLEGEKAKCMTCGASSSDGYWYEDKWYWHVEGEQTEEEEAAEAAAERAHAKKLISLEIAALKDRLAAFEGDDNDTNQDSVAGAGDVELAEAAGKDSGN